MVDYGSQWFWVNTITRLVVLAAIIAGIVQLERRIADDRMIRFRRQTECARALRRFIHQFSVT